MDGRMSDQKFRRSLGAALVVTFMLHVLLSGCLTTKAYVSHVHNQDPIKNPLVITDVEEATYIPGAGFFICLRTQDRASTASQRLGVFLPDATMRRPLDVITAKSVSFDDRAYLVSQELVLPNKPPQRYLFRSHRATDSCHIPDEIPIYRDSTIQTKNMPQQPIKIIKLGSESEMQAFTESKTLADQNPKVFFYPITTADWAYASPPAEHPIGVSILVPHQPMFLLVGGSDNRIHARHYPILAGTFLLDVISVPVQIILYMFLHKSD
jgi:hypothetical protein